MSDKKDISPTVYSFSCRFRPDFRYRDDKFVEVENNVFFSSTPSDTDKEAYRVTLSSLSGEIQRAVRAGNISADKFTFKDGKYDVNQDFSFLRRPDLTIVQLDEYIQHKEENLM